MYAPVLMNRGLEQRGRGRFIDAASCLSRIFTVESRYVFDLIYIIVLLSHTVPYHLAVIYAGNV